MLSSELPLYNCHKQVRAVEITKVIKHAHQDTDFDDVVFEASADFQGAHLFYDHHSGLKTIAVTADWYRRHKPEAGGYYVMYEDGYTSFSPGSAFEAGYTLDPNGATSDDMPEWYMETLSQAMSQLKSKLTFGTRTGLYDSAGAELCIGDIVQQPVTGNISLHGTWSRMLVWAQGVVPVLMYITSETGPQLPFGYLATPLSDMYDQKLLLWAMDTAKLRPRDELRRVVIE